MGIMSWNETLDIGVKDMNNEHKNLLELMNELYDHFNAKASYKVQKGILDKLKDATVEHFEHEEKYMHKIGWDQLPQHQYIHKNLLETFGRHYQKFTESRTLSDDFFHFLKFWLSAHIQGIDKKYGEFVKSGKKAS